ncbi:hypothetical protein [Pedobacter frigoris]|uniref:Uncharacterized protein n=1 Tax=Pedobacter frigoris TaxID=2571272 RepID=A0A4U1CIX5_9SPHI|nr:hypothetical protein [Pedobacter frigoris]TKC06930.1 hypothetical protein FA047_06575 [Pedobacter frigoris]
MSANFLLFVNHVLHEVLQNVYIDHERRLLVSKRLGKSIEIEMDNPSTQKIHYVPLWRTGYGPRNFKLFGALFSKTIIRNGGTQIQLSSMRNKRLHLSEYISEGNTKVIKQQINFIL